jgi:inward rectifier potassium channel
VAGYVATNLLFAVAYLLCGPGALAGSAGAESGSVGERFLQAVFFSVQTLATIGYGVVSPRGVAANLVVAVEALVGVIGFSMATGLTFARFARPSGQFLFSERAVVAPYRDATGFMFRVINPLSNQLVGVGAQVSLARMTGPPGARRRTFQALSLEREGVVFFPLHWTVVHPIDEKSPLRGVGPRDLEESEAEFVILVSGTDESSSQVVHARTSYKADEVVWNARFRDMFVASADGRMAVDVRRLGDVEPV